MTNRPISVGFVKPEEMEGNTIYVQLKRLQDQHNLYAEAVSSEDFNFDTYSIGGDLLEKKGTVANSTYGGGRFHAPEEFIGMLSRKNDAEVTEERFKDDGLALTLQMEQIRLKADVLFAHAKKLIGELVESI